MKDLKMMDQVLVAAVYIINIINDEINKHDYIETMPLVCRQLENNGNLIKHYARHMGVDVKAYELKYNGRDETVRMVKALLKELNDFHELDSNAEVVIPNDHPTMVMYNLLHKHTLEATFNTGVESAAIAMLGHLSNWYTADDYRRAAVYCLMMAAPLEILNLTDQDKEIINATT